LAAVSQFASGPNCHTVTPAPAGVTEYQSIATSAKIAEIR